ncbi:MAG: protein phosphatase 2C domain-containing protein [Chitinophagales bacterium]
MQIYTTLQRGHQHKHFCEDFLLHTSIGEGWQIAVVADGCSGGKDSHFASTLACKLIRKITEKEELVFNDTTAKNIGLKLLMHFMEELKEAQKQLQLETNELLSTLIFAVFNKTQAWLTVLGDGVWAVDGKTHIIDQNNTPDYPAYHLKDSENALQKYLTQNSFEVENPQELAIATDGILSFVSPQTKPKKSKEEIIDYLLCDPKFTRHPNILTRKCNILRTQNQMVNMDDLAIIRILY